VEVVDDLLLDGGQGGGRIRGKLSAGEGGAPDSGGDAQGAGDLGEGHFVQVLLAEGLEEALSGEEEFLGSIPFPFAEAVEARGPIGGLACLALGFGLGLSLQEAGVKFLEALGPVMFAGPVLDGAQGLAEFVGEGLMRARLTQKEEGGEGAIGARGFTGQPREVRDAAGELRVGHRGLGGVSCRGGCGSGIGHGQSFLDW
jgi:hypothetical protein